MNKHIPFPSIGQFKDAIKQVRQSAKWAGVPVPTVTFLGTTKLHGCVCKDTLITLADGSKEKISDVTVGTSILSYNVETSDIEFDVVKDVIIQDLDKKWVNLTFEDGRTLKCTEDHPILTTDGWIEAKDLNSEHEIIAES